MIQRIQSVFLLLLALSMLSIVWLPIWSKTDPLAHQTLVLTATKLAFTEGTGPAQSTWPIAALALASAAVATLEIFQFRNRIRQHQIGIFNLLLIMATIGANFYYSTQGERLLNPKLLGTYEAGFYLPTLALLLNLMANRFIRRDERLVRSMDRLR